MTGPCTHGMPTPGSCIDCMDEGNLTPPPRREPEHAVMAVTARWDSQCPACDLPIIPGQAIAVTNRDRWLHERCLP